MVNKKHSNLTLKFNRWDEAFVYHASENINLTIRLPKIISVI